MLYTVCMFCYVDDIRNGLRVHVVTTVRTVLYPYTVGLGCSRTALQPFGVIRRNQSP